ncbi:MAG: hypothetical protein ACOCVX_04775 [Bacteroidales bacterium]
MVFSLLFIGTGMFLHKYNLVFENHSDHDVLLQVQFNNAGKDSVYLVKPGHNKVIVETQTLKKKTKNQLCKEFINDLNELNLFFSDGSGFVNLIETKDEWLLISDKKQKKICIVFSDDK